MKFGEVGGRSQSFALCLKKLGYPFLKFPKRGHLCEFCLNSMKLLASYSDDAISTASLAREKHEQMLEFSLQSTE